jgi:hypothetical protein
VYFYLALIVFLGIVAAALIPREIKEKSIE